MQRNKLITWFHSERFWIIILSLLFLLSFSDILISKTFMLTHDSIDWYGIFHYFTESIYNGFWPLWNPYTHAGEPFYYNYSQNPLLEPVAFISILIGQLLKIDILTLYHWSFFIKLLCVNLGIYLFLRRFYKYVFTRIILFVIIVLSSLPVISLRVGAPLDTPYWTPWILIALFRIFKEKNTFNWILLATVFGLSFQQYTVVYSLSFFFILLMTFFLKNKINLKIVFSFFKRRNLKLLCLVFLIIVGLSSPLWTTFFLDSDKIIPVARTLDGTTKGFFLSFEEISQAEKFWRGATNIRDFSGLINPFFPYAFLKGWYSNYVNRAVLTESFLYIGILPLFLAIYGILFSRHKYKLNFLILLAAMGSMMLGTKSIFFRIFIYLFPPLRFARHSALFFPFFLLTLYYFAGLGLDHVIDKYERLKLELKSKNIKSSFIPETMILQLFSALIICFMCYFFGKKFTLDVRCLIYFYGLCIFFLLLLSQTLTMARLGKLILAVFIVTDLFIFNYFNRPLMLMNRRMPFSTQAEAITKLPEKRIFDIVDYSPMPRFKSLLFRKHAIEKNFVTMHCSFFELKNFNALMSIPVNNLNVIAGVSQPIIKFYRKALPYKDEYFYKYFKNPRAENILRTVLFINDVKTIENDLFYNDSYEKDISEEFDYKVLNYTPSDVEIEVQTKDKGFLYFSDGYDDYWNAYIDSKQTTLYRANINFKAVMVPFGTHTVRFIYKPIYHIFSLWLYFLTLAGVSLYIFRSLTINKSYRGGINE